MKTIPMLFLLLFCMGVGWVNAQLEITVSTNKNRYLAHERIGIHVKIENKSGSEIIMGGPTPELPWLSFDLHDPAGVSVQPVRPVQSKPMILRVKGVIENDFILNQYYPYNDLGVHSLTVSVYSSLDRNYYSSARAVYTMTEGREVWSQTVGVLAPEGGPGTRRKYSVIMLQEAGVNEAYIRVTDMEYEAVINTYSVGDVMIYGKPQAMVDEENRMQVLFMTKPRYWRHLVVNPDGRLLHQTVLENEGDFKPTLLANADGKIVVRGGVPYRGNEGPGVIAGEKIFRTSDSPVTLPE